MEDNTIFKTSSGMTLHLKPISRLFLQRLRMTVEKEFRDRGDLIDVPTYSFKSLGDLEVTEPLSEDSLEDPNDEAKTVENRKKWKAHKAAQTRLMEEISERTTAAILVMCVSESPTADSEWEDTMRWLGVEIPADPRDKKVLWLTSAILSDAEVMNLMVQVQMLTLGEVADEEMIAAAQESFRRAFRAQGRAAFAGLTDQEGEVVAQQPVPGSDGSIDVAPDAE